MKNIQFKKLTLLFALCLFLWGCHVSDDATSNIPLTSAQNKTFDLASQTENTVEMEEPSSNNLVEIESDEIPWGFDKESYKLYKSGALDAFIPPKSEVEQCVVADLDMDGINDVLLIVSLPESIDPENPYNYELNTLIIKGFDDGTYKLVTENREINYFSSYDASARVTAGFGWFKFTRARGTAGGYEDNYLFKYNEEKSDWFYAENYYNNYGYVEYGTSSIKTPKNFGIVTFGTYSNITNVVIDEDPIDPLSIDTPGFIVSVIPIYVSLQDKEKERRVNDLIADDLKYFIDELKALHTNVDINLSSRTTFHTPELISIEYNVSGTIGDYDLNYSGINRKYFTTIIDIDNVRRITLSDVIDIKWLSQVIAEDGFADNIFFKAETAKKIYEDIPDSERLKLLESADKIDAIFSKENTGIFCALHEKSICLYFQPEFFGKQPESEVPKLYIPIEKLLPYIKVPFWNIPSEAAVHIEWRG